MGSLIILFTSGDVSFGFQKPEWAVLFTWDYPRFPFDVTPADLLVALMAVKPILQITCQQALVGLEIGTYRAKDECSTD